MHAGKPARRGDQRAQGPAIGDVHEAGFALQAYPEHAVLLLVNYGVSRVSQTCVQIIRSGPIIASLCQMLAAALAASRLLLPMECLVVAGLLRMPVTEIIKQLQQSRGRQTVVDEWSPALRSHQARLAQGAQMEGDIGLTEAGGLDYIRYRATFQAQAAQNPQSIRFGQELEKLAQALDRFTIICVTIHMR